MGYVNKTYLSTQFKNFADKIAKVFSKIGHKHVKSDITERDKNFLLKLYDWIVAGKPELESVHNALSQGYIRKSENGYKAAYVGKYGAGYIQHWRGNGLSRYHVIEYHIIEY